MPGFGDSAFIIVLALLLFGPKKLPVLARQLGKLMAEFRRASNEFRTQMEEELRIAEQADRQKEIDKLQASAPSTATTDPALPHIPPPAPTFAEADSSSSAETETNPVAEAAVGTPEPAAAPVPIATSGELSIMPPSTGLPVAASSSATPTAAPETSSTAHEAEFETETLHG